MDQNEHLAEFFIVTNENVFYSLTTIILTMLESFSLSKKKIALHLIANTLKLLKNKLKLLKKKDLKIINKILKEFNVDELIEIGKIDDSPINTSLDGPSFTYLGGQKGGVGCGEGCKEAHNCTESECPNCIDNGKPGMGGVCGVGQEWDDQTPNPDLHTSSGLGNISIESAQHRAITDAQSLLDGRNLRQNPKQLRLAVKRAGEDFAQFTGREYPEKMAQLEISALKSQRLRESLVALNNLSANMKSTQIGLYALVSQREQQENATNMTEKTLTGIQTVGNNLTSLNLRREDRIMENANEIKRIQAELNEKMLKLQEKINEIQKDAEKEFKILFDKFYYKLTYWNLLTDALFTLLGAGGAFGSAYAGVSLCNKLLGGLTASIFSLTKKGFQALEIIPGVGRVLSFMPYFSTLRGLGPNGECADETGFGWSTQYIPSNERTCHNVTTPNYGRFNPMGLFYSGNTTTEVCNANSYTCEEYQGFQFENPNALYGTAIALGAAFGWWLSIKISRRGQPDKRGSLRKAGTAGANVIPFAGPIIWAVHEGLYELYLKLHNSDEHQEALDALARREIGMRDEKGALMYNNVKKYIELYQNSWEEREGRVFNMAIAQLEEQIEKLNEANEQLRQHINDNTGNITRALESGERVMRSFNTGTSESIAALGGIVDALMHQPINNNDRALLESGGDSFELGGESKRVSQGGNKKRKRKKSTKKRRKVKRKKTKKRRRKQTKRKRRMKRKKTKKN
tara:strand:+ start:3070 stop:5298 length:2229 start_codon:yes stop_codon:yes gene_type:complete